MKKLLTILFLFLFLTSILILSFGCTETLNSQDVVRIHIRANSNEQIDQNVKMIVKDAVVTYLTPMLANCRNSAEAKNILIDNINALTLIANEVLLENNFNYTSRVELKKEEFPYREYLSYSFPQGIYEALIIYLGQGTGDNWWCVCFPPLCFIPDDQNEETIIYKSKIKEIIKKIRG